VVTTTLLGKSATRPLLPKTPKRANRPRRTTRITRVQKSGVRATVKRRGPIQSSPPRRRGPIRKTAVKVDDRAVNHNFNVRNVLQSQKIGQTQRRKKRRGVRTKIRKQVKIRKQIRTRSFLI